MKNYSFNSDTNTQQISNIKQNGFGIEIIPDQQPIPTPVDTNKDQVQETKDGK